MLVGGIRAAARALGRYLPGSSLRVLAYSLGGVNVPASVDIGPGTSIDRSCLLGPDCRIGKRVTLGADVRIGRGCTIGDFARLSHLTAGEMTHIETNVLCLGARNGHITIGSHCYIGVGTLLDYSGDLIIGDSVHIAGPTAALHTHSSVPVALHGWELDGIKGGPDRREYGVIRIGGNSWIGGNVAIYPGSTVGDHCVVLPNSVVTSDVESFTMVGGVPARLVRRIRLEEGRTIYSA